MENVKKWLLKRVLFIVIGLVPIIILYDDSSPYRYLALVGFIIIIFNLIKIFGAYQEIIAAFSPENDNSKIGKYDKFFNLISGVYLIVSLFFLTTEIDSLESTFGGASLFWFFGLIGFVIAILIIQILKLSHLAYSSNKTKYGIYSCIILGSITISPATAGYLNYNYSQEKSECLTYLINELSISSGEHPKYYVFINNDSDTERFTVTEELYNDLIDENKIEICTSEGLFNYKIAREFKKK